MKLFPAAYSVARPASTPHFIQRTRHRRLPQLPQLPQLLGHSWRSCLRRLRPQLDARLHERKPGHLLLLPCSFFFRAFGFKMELVPPCTQGSSGPGQLPPRTFLSASSMKASCASWRSPFCYALRFSSLSLLLFAEGRLSCLEGPPRKAPQRRWPRRQSG